MFLKCPEKWRRRYIANEYEPVSGSLVAGSATGQAAGTNYQQKITSELDLPEEDVLDLYADAFALKVEQEDVLWDDAPGNYKDSGANALRAYQRHVAPGVTPVSVERRFTLNMPDVDWQFRGYIDLEEADKAVSDLKLRKQRLQKNDADTDLQATSYLLARRAEENPAPEFRFHTMVRTKQPYAEVVSTTRSDTQLDNWIDRLYVISAEMAWRTEMDIWDGAAPGSWYCSAKWCGFWDSCVLHP